MGKHCWVVSVTYLDVMDIATLTDGYPVASAVDTDRVPFLTLS